MSGPTLKRRGMLAAPNGDPILQKKLDAYVPLEYIIQWFKDRQNITGVENRVMVLKSETASGKSTALPPEIYEHLIMGQPTTSPGMICTQPRVLTAITNLRDQILYWYGSTEPGAKNILTLGYNTGWSTGNNKVLPTINASFLSATIDTLTAMLRSTTDEDIMKKFRYILIDETHERSTNLDLTITMLKNLLLRCRDNPACPFVVLMSATFDPTNLLKYFGTTIEKSYIWCRGANSRIDEMWDAMPTSPKNYIVAACDIVEKICFDDEKPGELPDKDAAKQDILIFLPSRTEFAIAEKLLGVVNTKLAKAKKGVFSLIMADRQTVITENIDFKRLTEPLNYQITVDSRGLIPSRRVILANSVAETGLTLDDLRHVIDSGYHFGLEYNPILRCSGVWPSAIPKSRWQQRRGRVGRKFPGIYWPLYPKLVWNELDVLQKPNIQIEDISSVFIDIVNEQYKIKWANGDSDPQFSVEDIDMVDVPTSDMLLRCVEKFYTLGFLSYNAPRWRPQLSSVIEDPDYLSAASDQKSARIGLSILGQMYARFTTESMSPESARMILAAYSWGVNVVDMITIAAYLSLDVKWKKNPLKPLDMGMIYKAGLPGFLSGTDMALRIKTLIADDFLDGLFIYQAIVHMGQKNTVFDAMVELEKWCGIVNLSYKDVIEFIALRDKFIEQFIISEFSLFRDTGVRIWGSTQNELMDTVCRFKHCIYDGYRENILVYDGTKYMTSNGVEVVVASLFQDLNEKIEKLGYSQMLSFKPKYLLFQNLVVRQNRKTKQYAIRASRTSVMDGFVSVDLNFIT